MAKLLGTLLEAGLLVMAMAAVISFMCWLASALVLGFKLAGYR